MREMSVSQMSSFSTDGQICIEREVVQTDPCEDLSDYSTLFDVEGCCSWIATNDVSKICLQFPDEWLSASVRVCSAMRGRLAPLTPALYVLADSAHSRCCADVVSARRAGADALIVFGGECGAEEEVTSSGLRVKRVAVRRALKVEQALAELVERLPPNVELPKLFLDVALKHHLTEVKTSWQRRFPGAPVLLLDKAPPDSSLDSDSTSDSQPNVCAYLGPRPRAMLRCALTMPDCEWISADWGSADGTKLSRRRRVQRERIRDARALGAVVCATGAPGTLGTLAELRVLAKAHGKRLYTLCVGEPTPPKLANFPEVEVYVIVACAESAWGELAERGERGELYRASVLPDTVVEALADYGSEPTLSLLSGRLRGVSAPLEAGEGTLALAERGWRGLAVTSVEAPAPHLAAPGRAGTAQHYTHELASPSDSNS